MWTKTLSCHNVVDRSSKKSVNIQGSDSMIPQDIRVKNAKSIENGVSFFSSCIYFSTMATTVILSVPSSARACFTRVSAAPAGLTAISSFSV